MTWFQLRQNEILDSFKENNKSEAELEHCEYYVEEQEEKPELKEKEVRETTSKSSHKPSQIRSQSVTQKDIKSTLKLGLTKRSSSRAKGVSNEKTTSIPQALTNLGKDVKDEIEIEGDAKKKKVLANPKMWPIYHNYRKLFSQSELKQLKKLKIIQEDGKINGTISRNKIKCY